MKRIVNYVMLSTAVFFSLYSCKFSPSEIPLTELEKPSEIAPAISIDLSPDMDTLRLSEPAWVTYSVEIGNRQLYQIDVAVDDVAMVDLRYDSPTKVLAYIPANLMDDGNHEIRITTYTSTNSGSIADKTGGEVYQYEIRWPVLVNKHAKDEFVLNDPEPMTGGIRISWPRYLYADFDRYEFSWSTSGYQSRKISITDPYQNAYIDNSYVEGCYMYYSVFTYYTVGGFSHDNLNYSEKINEPVVYINEDLSVDIQWTHSKYEQNVKLYCLRTSVPNYGSFEEHDLTDLADTTLQLDEKMGFGGDYQIQLRYIPKGYDSYHTALNTDGGLTQFALGDSLPRFQEAFFSAAENSLILYQGGTVTKYHLLTGESSTSISIVPGGNDYTGKMNGSSDGNCFGYFEGQNYVVRRSSDLSVIKKMDIGAYDGFNLRLNSVAVTDNGLIGTIDYSGNFRVFDYTSVQKIYEKKIDSNYYPKKVLFSPDGKNLAIMANDYGLGETVLIYYSFDRTQLVELGRVSGVGEDYWEVLAYGPPDKQELVVSRWRSLHRYNVEVRDSRTFELLYSVEVPSLFVPVAYDFTTDRVIAQYHASPPKKFSYLIDMKTGEMKKTVLFSGKTLYLFNDGIVFSGNGRSILIDDFIIE